MVSNLLLCPAVHGATPQPSLSDSKSNSTNLQERQVMKNNSMDRNAIHIWQHDQYLDNADILIWTELKLVLMSGLVGWWFISPFACAYSRELTPEFVATFFNLRSNAYRLFRNVFKNNGVEELADEYFDLPENQDRRDLDVEGWLVNSYFSEFEKGKFLPNAKIYRGNDKAKLLFLNGGCIWHDFRYKARKIQELIASSDICTEVLTGIFRDLLNSELEDVHQSSFPNLCSLVTPHATVTSAFPTSEFFAKATEVKNEWYSILNKLRGCYSDLPIIAPVLEICGSVTSLKDLKSLECGTLTRTRINRTQRVHRHPGTVRELQRLHPIQHLLTSLFNEAPVPHSRGDALYSKRISNDDRFRFFTETLPLHRRNDLDLIDHESSANPPSSQFGDKEPAASDEVDFSESSSCNAKFKKANHPDSNWFNSLDSVPKWLREYFPLQEQQSPPHCLNQLPASTGPTALKFLTHFSAGTKRETNVCDRNVEHSGRILESALL